MIAYYIFYRQAQNGSTLPQQLKILAKFQLDNLSALKYIILMEEVMAVGELKAQFSTVQKGQKVDILYGRAKKPVATIIPYQEKFYPTCIQS